MTTVTVTQGNTTVVTVATAGPQGPGGGGAAYVHTQSTPATTWTINHNLGFRPTV